MPKRPVKSKQTQISPHPTTETETPPQRNLLRLNKVLARHGLCSRRKADEWVREGRVSVDGIICREVGVQIDVERQRVVVDGKLLEHAPPHYYVLLNKPTGIVTTRSDPQGRQTVLHLLPNELIEAGVFPVGRLDNDSQGLLLLTNDGDWGQILLHPRHQIWKEYRVEIDKPLTPDMKKQMEQGVAIDEDKPTLPSRITFRQSDAKFGTRFTIAIREGRNRQIRRMCSALGLTVRSLQRLKMGPIQLGNLKIGSWRFLEETEVEMVRQIENDLETEDSTT